MMVRSAGDSGEESMPCWWTVCKLTHTFKPMPGSLRSGLWKTPGRRFGASKHFFFSKLKIMLIQWKSVQPAMGGFPGGSGVKNPPASAGDMGSIPGPGRSYMSQSNQAHVPQLLRLCSRAQVPELTSLCTELLTPMCPRARAL